MKQEHEGTGKRPVAMPVVLVLLVISMIGNVFLYTKYLQNVQERKYAEGLAIYEGAQDSLHYFQATADGLRGLLEADSLERRLEQLLALGEISHQRNAVIALLKTAEAFKPEYAFKLEDIERRLDGVNEALARIGAYEGALVSEERVFIEQLLAQFESYEGIASSFNRDVIDYRSSVIRLAAGYGWLDMTDNLYASLTQ